MTLIDLIGNLLEAGDGHGFWAKVLAIVMILVVGFLARWFIGTWRIANELEKINETLQRLIKK